jgi:mannan endo-1,4-beta-mannosidase
LVVGEFGSNHSDGNPDEDTIMAEAQTRGLGYIGWSWSGNSGGVEYLDMVTNFNPATLTAWGERFLNGPNGVRQTSREASIYGGGGGDTQPPSTPGTPVASGVTATSVTLNWTASTDDVGVTGYEVYRAAGNGSFTVVGSPATTTFTSTGLTASTTYRFQVRARDAVPNFSANSGILSVTTQSGGGGGSCRVSYSTRDWSNGFTATVTVTNTGTTTVDGWTLGFSYTEGQRVTQPGWGATWTQAAGSANVTGTNLSWNSKLAPNASTGIGFNGTRSGPNPAPASFTLNGNPCTTS